MNSTKIAQGNNNYDNAKILNQILKVQPYNMVSHSSNELLPSLLQIQQHQQQSNQNLLQKNNNMLGKKRNFDYNVNVQNNNKFPIFINTGNKINNGNIKNFKYSNHNQNVPLISTVNNINTNINYINNVLNNSIINHSNFNNNINKNIIINKDMNMNNHHHLDQSTTTITKDLVAFYNMSRSIYTSCVKPNNKKYSTNSFIPCLPFP